MAPSQPPQSVDTVVELLRWRAEVATPESGFAFLEDGDGSVERLSFENLERRSRAIAQEIGERLDTGDRAILLYPPSLEYVEAFFGCLYAGVVAVPAYPPNPNQLERTLPRLRSIVDDADAAAALATRPIEQMAEAMASDTGVLAGLDWIATDEIGDEAAGDWTPPGVDSDAIAFLQYTSGSTGQPKGVMVDHGALLRNQDLIHEAFGAGEDDVGVNWLPMYHDMGLLGAIVQPVYCGCDSVLMSPLDFLKRPASWLEAISKFGGTMSTAPNFGYDLAVRKTDEELRDRLDLSSWKVACNGAEPVRNSTMERFADYFGPSGFKESNFMPAYGLAEVGLIVSATPREKRPKVVSAEGKTHVSCGELLGDFDAAIVDPDARRTLPEGEVGEVWLKNGSITGGYWNKDDINRQIFEASPEDADGTCLRTGDLGFVADGELVITGRLKDVIVIRGVNHYPHDIEATVESVDPAIRPGCGAAFSVEDDDETKLVIVQEVRTGQLDEPDAMIAAIRDAVSAAHRVVPAEVVLIEPRTIEKTSSGKLKRYAVRDSFVADELSVVARSGLEKRAERDGDSGESRGPRGESRSAVEQWLVDRIADQTGLARGEIDPDAPFSAYGIDSAEAVGIVGELERWLDCELSATALYDFPTISALAVHLGEKRQNGPRDKPRRTITSSASPGYGEPIAVVGMACRFPGGENLEQFWELLQSGEDAFDVVDERRWTPETFSDPDVAGFDTIATDRGGFVEEIEWFDAGLFGISPKEARAMDPQQRMMLETAHHALEDAGWPAERLAGTPTGVFIGQSGSDFARLYDGPPVRAGSGIAPSITANRLSYLLDLRGPSQTVDTACSSSLVALDQAVLQLRSGRCDRAIVGGVNAILAPDMSVAFSRARMLSTEGVCRVFDEDADGYVRGEGCGVVVLRPLEEAKRRGDEIRAVIRGAAINQDGRTNGLTAPRGPAQREVIESAWEDAGVDASGIDAVEAHGTGTELGDAIEAKTLGELFDTDCGRDRRLWLGSVKAQIGHLEAAAGIAGVIKAALCVRRGRIGPQANFETPNPACDFEQGPLEIPRNTVEWTGGDGGNSPRRMGVSAFGFGGTNAHVVIEQPPEPPTKEADTRPAMIGVGAPDDSHLEAYIEALLADESIWTSEATVRDLGWTLGRCRSAGTVRIAFGADSPERAREKLRDIADAGVAERAADTTGGDARIGFVYGGNGDVVETAGRLREELPGFRRRFDDAVAALGEAGASITAESFDAGGSADAGDEAFQRAARFAFQVALTQLFDRWGLLPDVVESDAGGGPAAAYATGERTLEEVATAVVEGRSADGFEGASNPGEAIRRAGVDIAVEIGADVDRANSSVESNESSPVWVQTRDLAGRGVAGLMELAARVWRSGGWLRRDDVNAGGRRIDVPKMPLLRRHYWPSDDELRRIEPGE